MILSRQSARVGAAWAAVRRRHRWLDHIVRAVVRYDQADGGRLAAAVTYYAFFAVFALCLLGFAVFGFVLNDPAVAGAVGRYLAANLPRLDVDALRDARGTAGLLALLALPIIGLFWVDALRSSIRAMWRLPEYPGPYLQRQVIDLGVLAALGALVAATMTVALTTQAAVGWLVDAVDADATAANILLTAVGFGLGVAVNTALAVALLTGLPRLTMPARRVLGPALLVAAGLELLKTIGRIYVERTEANPAFQVVAGAVGLLIFLNVVNQLILFAAALTATGTAGKVTDLAARGPDRPASPTPRIGTATTGADTAATATTATVGVATSRTASLRHDHHSPATEKASPGRPDPVRLRLTLCLPRDLERVRMGRDILTTALTDSGVAGYCRDEILTALAEACNNVVQHADPADQYDVSVEIAEQRCTISVTDTGGGFAPTTGPYHPTPLDAESGPGLSLIATLPDQFQLSSHPGPGTTVQFSKQLTYTDRT